MTIDRRLLTDIGLALLIALPSALPAAPGPWNSNDELAKADKSAVEAPADSREWADSIATPGFDRNYGRS